MSSEINKFNILYYANNLTIMQEIPSNSIDLIYLDPPFNTGRNYFQIDANPKHNSEPEISLCFKDKWGNRQQLNAATEDLRNYLSQCTTSSKIIKMCNAILHNTNQYDRTILTYLTHMIPRMLEMKRILKPTGSIYIHCDQKINHYIKITLDAIFGRTNFKNEIVWKRQHGNKKSQHKPRSYGSSADILLFYSKTKNNYFKPLMIEKDEQNIKNRFTYTDQTGEKFKTDRITLPKCMMRKNLIYKYKNYTPRYGWMMKLNPLMQLDKQNMLYWSKTGKPYRKQYFNRKTHNQYTCNNIWMDIYNEKERQQDYPTQKPIALLKRIISISCPENGIVFDPYCGSGTTLIAASSLQCKWIGCDNSIIAINTTIKALEKQGLHVNQDYITPISGSTSQL